MSKETTNEILDMMSESKGVILPNFVPPHVFDSLARKQLDKISIKCEELVDKTHQLVESVHKEIVTQSRLKSPPVLPFACVATARIIIGRSRDQCASFVENMLRKEHAAVFTKNALYMEIIQGVQANMEATKAATISPSTDTSAEAQAAEQDCREALARFEREIGTVDLTEVTNGEVTDEFKRAWDMKLSVAAYWAVVKKRIADSLPHQITYSLQQALVYPGLYEDPFIRAASAGYDFEYLMEEEAVLALRRRKLDDSIERLRKVVATLIEFGRV